MTGLKTGYIKYESEWGDIQEADTYNCCHCQYVVRIQPGSGKQRGYCTLCTAPTCGGEHCLECKPFMKMIEELEARGRLHQAMEGS